MNDSISKEEAISVICRVCEVPNMYKCKGRNVAFKWCEEITALKEIPSVKPKPSTDIQGVLEYLDDVLHPLISPDNWNVYSELHDMVSMLPSAESKKGKWILDPDGIDWNIPAWRCSECGFVATHIGVEPNGLGDNPLNWAGSKFCPHCGADMRSGKEERWTKNSLKKDEKY